MVGDCSMDCAVSNYLGLLEPALSIGQGVLDAQIRAWRDQHPLPAVLEFVLTVWAAICYLPLSACSREDVYPG